MDDRLLENLKECFMQCNSMTTKTAEEAYGKAAELLENNLKNIDFDDDDDVKGLFEVIHRALTYEDDHLVPHGEAGIMFLKLLISKGFDINFKLLKKECLILYLADYCWIAPEIFGQIVDLGADVYSENNYGNNVLSIACSREYKDAEPIAIYIAEHYDISKFDHPDKYGVTPLLYAILEGKPRIAEALIKNGANVNATGGQANNYRIKTYGVSPFAAACRMGDVETAKLLLDAGADETCCDTEGIPASFCLAFTPGDDRKAEIVSLLKNIEKTDSNGNTLLLKLLERCDYPEERKINPYNNRAVISALIERGANVNAANNEGKRPIHYAAKYLSESCKELLAAGADINAQDNDGNTALTLVCLQGAEKEARMLIRKGADFKIKNNAGKTAADIAAEKGLLDVLELMI